MTPPSGSEPPGWVVWSTRASIDARTPSLTAIVETMIAVPLYWWLAIHFETFLPLLVSACVAPLVLLRSDASVALGVRLFMAWEKRDHDSRAWNERSARERGYVWAAVIALVTGAGALGYMTAKSFIAGQEAWPSFWRGAILGYGAVVVAGAAAGALVAAAAGALLAVGAAAGAGALLAAGAAAGAGALVVALVVVGALVAEGMTSRAGGFKAGMALVMHPVFLGFAFGIFLASVAVRIFATLCHPAAGLKSLPDNFRRLVFCASPLQIPELVPSLAETETKFTLAKQLQEFNKDRQSTISRKVIAYLFRLPAIVVWFGPAWCYRFILKSTAWFWWPLAFLGGEARLAKTPRGCRHLSQTSAQARWTPARKFLAVFS